MKTAIDLLSESISDVIGALSNSLVHSDIKLNYDDQDLANTTLIFSSVLMSKMWDLQQEEDMTQEDRENMATKCGEEIRSLVKTYTGIDLNDVK